MMRWSLVSDRTKYGVSIYNFMQENHHTIPLNVGDTVYIFQETEDWYYGCCTRNKTKRGIFPKTYIRLKNAIIDKTGLQETILPHEPPIIHEITSVLREWGMIWKQMYVNNNLHFEEVRNMMYELIDWRKQILSGTLPVDELKDLKQRVTATIDMGNAILNLDMVVRDAHGNILNPDITSVIDLYRAHEEAAARIKKMFKRKVEVKSQRLSTSYCHNLFVTVKNFVCRIGEDADLLMTLYDAKESTFISENYLVKWGKAGLAKNVEQLNNLRVLFTDLGSKDLSREKVFLICQIIRIGAMELKDSDYKRTVHSHKKLSDGIRRPFGVAAMDITDIISGKLESDEEKQFFVPFLQCGERDFLDNVIRKVLAAKDLNQKEHKGQGLWVCMKLLHGDLKQVREENPHLVSTSTAIARKMGFPEVILPGDVRNDLYLTLVQGEFTRGSKSTEKNVEVTVRVCNEKGQLIPGVISVGAGCEAMDEYKSVIYYHEDKPKWTETFKVAIPIEDFYSSHLKYTFKHRSSNEAKDKAEKVFAMSFVKLMQTNGTTLNDEAHELLVYKVDHKKFDESDVSYLSLPSTRIQFESQMQNRSSLSLQMNGLVLSLKDSFSISTLVCSTKLTQNVDLLGLLKWWTNPDNLENNLLALMKVDGEEVVKFLQDTLDALFSILMQNSNSDVYDDQVFEALVFIIGLISDRKYHHFRPVLDVYIKDNYSATLAYDKLMVVLKSYVDNTNVKENHEKLLKTMKTIEYIFKFVVRSRQLFAALNEGKGKQSFESSLKQLLQSLTGMMLYKSDFTLAIQGTCLKFFPHAIPDILTVFDGIELSKIVVELINNIPKDRITRQKLNCMNDVVFSDLFKLPECRRILMPEINQQIKQLLEKEEEVELCIKIYSDILVVLHEEDVGPTYDDIKEIILDALRTIIQTVIDMKRDNVLVGNMVAVMIAIFREMTLYHYNHYADHFATTTDLLDFLMEILMVFRVLVNNIFFQNDWNEMIMLQNSVILKTLRFFAQSIKEQFNNPFEYQVWNNFFHCAISFLTQDALQLEKFSQNKRNKIVARYKDMRRETGFEIRSMWFNLGAHKIKFVPGMVGPFLEMTLIPEVELRRATIPIFFDMMLCEFYSPRPPMSSIMEEFYNNREKKANFNEFENEMITQLDVLIEGGRGDEQYKELFLETLGCLCEHHPAMHEQGMKFVQTSVRLIKRLLDYRAIMTDESKENRMSCIVSLLEFYFEINRKEMYIRYLYKLCDLHLDCENYVEAALTLKMHARLLRWSEEPLPQLLKNDKYPRCETHRELKEQLYYNIIDHLDKGKLWEVALQLCKELVEQYEAEVFDYIRLSELLQRMAVFYDNIMKQVRPEPEYFRVGYYGKGFPAFLQNKEFVYRGKAYERLSDFQGRLLNQFPKAQLLTKLTPPENEIKDSSLQYLQINKVDPLMQDHQQFKGKVIHEQILKYYRVNEVQKFTYSRRVQKGQKDSDNEFENLWIERTTLETAYPLPGILRWFSITNTIHTSISPLMNAIETIETTNLRLKETILQYRGDPTMPINPLSMLLNGVVDAAVMGGIVNYEKAFFTEDYLQKNNSKDEHENIQKLKDVIACQVPLLEAGILIHKRRAPDNLKPLHDHMEEAFAKLRNHVEEKYGKRVPPNDLMERHVAVRRPKVSLPLSPIKPERTSSNSTTSSEPARKTLSGSISSLSPQKSNPTSRAQSVWVKPSSPSTKLMNKKNRESGTLTLRRSSAMSIASQQGEVQSQSQWYDILPQGPPVIELSEQLTSHRPQRPESERRYSRPTSGQFKTPDGEELNSKSSSLSSLCLMASPASTPTEDKPPPLPQKQAYADYTNITDDMTFSNMQRNSSLTLPLRVKNKPPPPLPAREGSPIVSPKISTRPLTEPLDSIPPALPKKPSRIMSDISGS